MCVSVALKHICGNLKGRRLTTGRGVSPCFFFFRLRVIWIELIRRPLVGALARCHGDMSSVEKGTPPQVSPRGKGMCVL